MTQEQKDLLLKDLCARLPYGVICKSVNFKNPTKLVSIDLDGPSHDVYFCTNDGGSMWNDYDEIKPYLFPLSSMTEEQIKELSELGVSYGDYALHDSVFGLGISVDEAYIFFEFCYKHHIDFLGLIDLGLAIDATGKNIY